MKTNLFNNMSDPNVIDDIEVNEILQTIKDNPEKVLIIEARKHGKGHPIYERNKSKMKTYSPNAFFYCYRSKKNIKGLTGFIYLDVESNIPPSVYMSMPFVYACWKSFGGTGYGLLAAVSGLTVANFTDTWHYFENYFMQYNLKLDRLTKDIARQNVISYDPDIYINEYYTPVNACNVIPIPSSISVPSNFFSSTTTALFDQTEYVTNSTFDGLEKLRYYTVLDDYNNQDYIVFENGKEFMRAHLPFSILKGDRHKWLFYHIACLIFNNIQISQKRLEVALLSANKNHCTPKLESKEVKAMVEWMYDKHKNNQLTFNAKKKKIWFNPASKLSLEEKRSIVGRVVGSLRRNRTIKKLTVIYIQLDLGNRYVTQKMLMENSGMSLRTIKKYWNQIIY